MPSEMDPQALDDVIGANRHNFGYLALSNYTSSSSADIFRMQSGDLQKLVAKIRIKVGEGLTRTGVSLEVSKLLGQLMIDFSAHNSLVDGIIHRRMAGDQQNRLLAENFVRDMKPVMASVAGLARKFPSPSAVIEDPKVFAAESETVFRALESRLQEQERELFVKYDQMVKSA